MRLAIKNTTPQTAVIMLAIGSLPVSVAINDMSVHIIPSKLNFTSLAIRSSSVQFHVLCRTPAEGAPDNRFFVAAREI